MIDLCKEVLLSFYAPSVYNVVARQRRGIGVTFILALTVIVMLVGLASLQRECVNISTAINNAPAIADNLPAVTFKDGKLSIDKPVPDEIRLGADANFIIDTNYKISDLSALQKIMKQEKIFALVTADALVTLGKDDELKIDDFRSWRPFVIQHEDWKKFGQATQKWGLPAIVASFLIFGFSGIFLFSLIATFCSAVVVAIISVVLRASLEFDASMRLAALARIPATIIPMIPPLFGMNGYAGMIGWLVWGGYLILAVAANRQAPAL